VRAAYLLVELHVRRQVQGGDLGRGAEVVGELHMRVRHALNVFGRLKLFRRHRRGLVSGHLLVVAVAYLFKFNVRYFLMVHLSAVVIGDVARKLREVGGHKSVAN